MSDDGCCWECRGMLQAFPRFWLFWLPPIYRCTTIGCPMEGEPQ